MSDGLVTAALGEDAPAEAQVRVERVDAEGDPDSWARAWVDTRSVGGGWVQLADRVLGRRAGAGWITLDGDEGYLDGWVLSAEGIDGDGVAWRLRRIGDLPVVWRVHQGVGERALRFERRYLSNAPAVSSALRTFEFWTLRREDELAVGGAAGLAWVPYFACFAGWGDDDGER